VKLVRAVLVSVCALAAAGPAQAARSTTRLTPANVAEQPLSFTVKAERVVDDKKGKSLGFRVAVAKKDKGGVPPRRAAQVEVYDGAAFVASCPAQETVQDGRVSYSFEVAAKYAEKSTFGFYEDLSTPGGPPAGRYYWFYLTDFIDPVPAAPKPADPLTPGMRAALAKANAVHTGMDRKTIDDAVAQLHQAIGRDDPKVFVPPAVPHLIRLAPYDTATRVLLRKALADGWLGEFAARMYLVQAGDPPGPHIAAMLKAVGGNDPKARRAALTALRGVGAAGADALPALRKFVIDAKAPQTDFQRDYTLRSPAPDHVLAYWADNAISAAIKDAAAKPKPEPPVDLSRFPKLRGKVKTILGHLNTYIPPKEGEPFELSLKDLPKLTSLRFDPAEKSYTALYAPAAVESVRYYTNGAFASMRLVSTYDPKIWRGSVTIDIIAGGGKFQMWVVYQGDVMRGVVLIEGEYDGTFPDRQK